MVTEGGIHPWKRLPADGVQYWDPKVMKTRLPPPPPGAFWVRDERGHYELKYETRGVRGGAARGEDDETKTTEPTSSEAASSEETPGGGPKATNKDDDDDSRSGGVKEHVVLPTDTLSGLSIKYGVSRAELRRWNRLLDAAEDCVRTRETLVIPPLSKARRARGQTRQPRQLETRDVAIQRFRNATRLGRIEAEVYLEAASWDLAAALKRARADDAFEADAARFHAELEARAASEAAFSEGRRSQKNKNCVVVHLDSAEGLNDLGVLTPMDVYVVATLWAGDRLVAEGASCAVAKSGSRWRWLPTQEGSTVQLALPTAAPTTTTSSAAATEPAPEDDDGWTLCHADAAEVVDHDSGGKKKKASRAVGTAVDDDIDPRDLTLTFVVRARNHLLDDADVGRSKRLPLSRLVDHALHAVSVDTGGELALSVTAPDTVPRDCVRAVAVPRDDSENPFIDVSVPATTIAADAPGSPPRGTSSSDDDPLSALVHPVVVEAVAVRADDNLPAAVLGSPCSSAANLRAL
mmetsp:Transcript_952/g.3773  ORF Transcript_952/g.3773 Transcript_952/m.3773 type:complete len:521 (-) Transcript_952:389-1951(-)